MRAHGVCVGAPSICVGENLNLHFLNFVCVCVHQGSHIAHKFESGWEVGVIKTFDKKGSHAGKFASSAVILLEVTYDCSMPPEARFFVLLLYCSHL